MHSPRTNEVILIRHGQTVWNLEKRTQGHLDSPLTELGIAQAKTTAEKLKDRHIELIVSSPLGRALRTAEIVRELLNISAMETNDLLIERNLGVLQGRTKEELFEEFPHFWGSDGRFIRSVPVPDGESIDEFLNRVARFVEKMKIISKSKHLLVVTHDGVLHAIMGLIKDIPFKEVQRYYTFSNGEPYILQV